MTTCMKEHDIEAKFVRLPDSQAGSGRHRCCGCAYERGFAAGRRRDEAPSPSLDTLPESQAGKGRHKSAHVAWALGYYDGLQAAHR